MSDVRSLESSSSPVLVDFDLDLGVNLDVLLREFHVTPFFWKNIFEIPSYRLSFLKGGVYPVGELYIHGFHD